MIRCTALLVTLIALLAPSAFAEQIAAARYDQPVNRYGHFALGRPHEYARLVATTDTGRDLEFSLPDNEVFEDLVPRLVRLSDQAPSQLLVIVSSRNSGARLMLVGLVEGRLVTVAQSAPIGTPNRWLNPVGVADLNGDGESEIAAVITPHIGGVLKVYRVSGDRLVEIDAMPGFSNHVYGSSKLALSKPSRIAGRQHLLVPDVTRTVVRVMSLRDERLIESDRCALSEPITGPDLLGECERRLNGAVPNQ